ncbi:CDP-glycerol glycerophosphotransferase family protein [Pseudomonas aeruginosa]
MIEDSVSEPGRRDGGDAGKRLAWLQRQVLPVLEEGDAVWVSGLDGAPFAGGAHKVVEASAAGELPGNERFRLACLGGAVGGVADDWQAMRLLLRAVESLEDRGWLLLEEVLSVCAAGACRSPQAQARLALSLGLRQVAELHLGAPDDGGRQRVLQLFRQDLAVARMQRYSGLRVACYGNMPFHYRSLRPLAECFEDSLLSLDIDEVMAWKPDVIAVADGWSVEFWRDYCDAHNVLLVGMRHGSVTRYGFAEGTYRYADYLCGSAWDIDDTLASSVMPRNGFLLTGNAWCDEVFRLPARTPAENAPTILFAPTYNPEISAAVHLGERVVALIRKVYPASRIIIKPHPAIVQHEHAFVSDKDLFRDLMKLWREQSRTDPLVTLVDDPEASIAASFAEADILLADRSSLIFEFMTLDRPILLFSREQRIARWAYNPEAPGNAWRDIGLEFADDEQLLDLLANAFTRHAESRDTQENRTQQLYGRFRDGRSGRSDRRGATLTDRARRAGRCGWRAAPGRTLCGLLRPSPYRPDRSVRRGIAGRRAALRFVAGLVRRGGCHARTQGFGGASGGRRRPVAAGQRASGKRAPAGHRHGPVAACPAGVGGARGRARWRNRLERPPPAQVARAPAAEAGLASAGARAVARGTGRPAGRSGAAVVAARRGGSRGAGRMARRAVEPVRRRGTVAPGRRAYALRARSAARGSLRVGPAAAPAPGRPAGHALRQPALRPFPVPVARVP